MQLWSTCWPSRASRALQGSKGKKKETITVYLRVYIYHLMQLHPILIKSTPEKATARCKVRAFQFCYNTSRRILNFKLSLVLEQELNKFYFIQRALGLQLFQLQRMLLWAFVASKIIMRIKLEEKKEWSFSLVWFLWSLVLHNPSRLTLVKRVLLLI